MNILLRKMLKVAVFVSAMTHTGLHAMHGDGFDLSGLMAALDEVSATVQASAPSSTESFEAAPPSTPSMIVSPNTSFSESIGGGEDKALKKMCYGLLHAWTDINIRHLFQGAKRMTWLQACTRAQDLTIQEILKDEWSRLVREFVNNRDDSYFQLNVTEPNRKQLVSQELKKLEEYAPMYYVDAFKAAYRIGYGDVLKKIIVAISGDDSEFIEAFNQALMTTSETLPFVFQVNFNSLIPVKVSFLTKKMTQRLSRSEILAERRLTQEEKTAKNLLRVRGQHRSQAAKYRERARNKALQKSRKWRPEEKVEPEMVRQNAMYFE